jgi:hypothetical protein
MLIYYTGYAEDTILDRDISKKEIEEVLLNPDEITLGKKDRKIAHKILSNNKFLRVIFEDHKKAYIVITAYYTKLERYMKK